MTDTMTERQALKRVLACVVPQDDADREAVKVLQERHDGLLMLNDNRSIYDHRIAVQRAAEAAGPRLYVALKALLEAVEERRDLAESIETVVLSDARAALAVARVQPRP